MSLIARTVDSVLRKGLVATLGTIWRHVVVRASQWADFHFDWVNGTDTAGIVETTDLVVTGPNQNHGVRYQPTRARPFRRLMTALCIPSGEVFVDIGSGKGRVLMLAADFGFRKIVGVEYAAGLCEIARRNLSPPRYRGRSKAPAIIHCCDAADYVFAEDETVIYMFNPFDAIVLGKMLERLAGSLRLVPRKAWLIYYFPRWKEVVESHGMFIWDSYHEFGGCEFAVFVHVPHQPQYGLPGQERNPVRALA